MSIGRNDAEMFATPLPHPGDVLRDDFLPAYGLTAGALAKRMGLADRARVERIVRAKGGISADTALRLARVFDTSAALWLNMQTAYDLSVAEIASRASLAAIEKVGVPADV